MFGFAASSGMNAANAFAEWQGRQGFHFDRVDDRQIARSFVGDVDAIAGLFRRRAASREEEQSGERKREPLLLDRHRPCLYS